jgi:hypothetical protein
MVYSGPAFMAAALLARIRGTSRPVRTAPGTGGERAPAATAPADAGGVRHPALIAALIVAGAAVLRLAFFSGFILYDDYHYVVRAFTLSQGHLVPPVDIFGTRVGVVGPAALLYRLFGVSKLTTGAYPFACSVLGVLAAYVLGRRLFGASTGLLAAALLAVFPLDVLYASTLFATAPVTLAVGVSLGLFLLAEQEDRRALYLASGLVLGAGVLVHESVVVVAVFYPAYALLVARPRRAHLLVGLGCLAVVALDPVVHGLLGDPWARFRFFGGAAVAGKWTDANRLGPAWLVEPVLRLLSEQELGLFPLVVVPVALLGLRRAAPRNQHALALFVTVVALWLLYGTASPFRYAPLSRQPRYLAPVVMAGALLVAHDLVAHRRWRTRALVTAALAVTGVACVALDGGRLRLRPLEEARAVLAQARAERVVVEPWLRPPLLVAEGFAPRYAVATLDAASAPPSGAFVVVADDDGRRRVAALPGAERIASIGQPPSPYLALLRNPAVGAVLRATRPGYRLRDLEAKARPWTLEVYRMR